MEDLHDEISDLFLSLYRCSVHRHTKNALLYISFEHCSKNIFFLHLKVNESDFGGLRN